MNLLKLGRKPLKIVGSVFLFFLYLYGYWMFGWILLILVLTIIGFSVYLFFADKQRIEVGNERFRNRNLFFRYGENIDTISFPLKTKDQWTAEDVAKFGDSIIYSIHDTFITSFGYTPLNGKQLVSIITVTDSQRQSDVRGFLKLSFTGSRGAIFSRFITYQILGKNLILTKLIFLLGMVQWYDKLFYFLSSPFSLPTWIYKWTIDEYSIYSSIASEIDNDFEIFDIRSYLESSGDVISSAINKELMNNGLYTSEIGNTIIGTFNDNSINVNHGGIQNTGNSSGSVYENISMS